MVGWLDGLLVTSPGIWLKEYCHMMVGKCF